MCGKKIISGSKFCDSCGLNLIDYQKKLDGLSSGAENGVSRQPAGANILSSASIIINASHNSSTGFDNGRTFRQQTR